MLVYTVIEKGAMQLVDEIDVPKGRRLDVAMKKWVEENGKERTVYVGMKVLVPEMKIKKVSKIEVVYA